MIGVILMASSIIDKRSLRRECRKERPTMDLRRQTRRKRSTLSLGRLNLSSCYFLKHSKIDISERIEIFPARDLAKNGSRARSCRHETLELAERESPFDWALRSHGPCGDRVSHPRALGADA
jgi:hypothetical protein